VLPPFLGSGSDKPTYVLTQEPSLKDLHTLRGASWVLGTCERYVVHRRGCAGDLTADALQAFGVMNSQFTLEVQPGTAVDDGTIGFVGAAKSVRHMVCRCGHDAFSPSWYRKRLMRNAYASLPQAAKTVAVDNCVRALDALGPL
jgi:hypothetical protein